MFYFISVFYYKIFKLTLEFVIREVEIRQFGNEVIQVTVSLEFGVAKNERKFDQRGNEEIVFRWLTVISFGTDRESYLLFCASIPSDVLGGLVFYYNVCYILTLCERLVRHYYFVHHGDCMSATKFTCISGRVLEFILKLIFALYSIYLLEKLCQDLKC